MFFEGSAWNCFHLLCLLSFLDNLHRISDCSHYSLCSFAFPAPRTDLRTSLFVLNSVDYLISTRTSPINWMGGKRNTRCKERYYSLYSRWTHEKYWWQIVLSKQCYMLDLKYLIRLTILLRVGLHGVYFHLLVSSQ